MSAPAPKVATSLARSSTTSWLRARSRAAVGSSTRSSAGLVMKARAIPTRCRSPPDSSCGRRSALWLIDTASRSSRGSRARSSSGDMPAILSASRSWSRHVSAGMRLPDWNTKPIRSRRSRAFVLASDEPRSTPSTRTVPDSGVTSAPATARSEDLPEPDGPTTATSSPAVTSRLTASSAVTVESPSPCRRVTPSSSRTERDWVESFIAALPGRSGGRRR